MTEPFHKILNDAIETDKALLNELKSLNEESRSTHKNANIAKTVGTSFSCVGAALTIGSVAAAPFTGGLSLVAGLGLSVVGGVTNIGTNIAEYKISKSTIKKILEKVTEKEEKFKLLNNQMKEFNKAKEKLIKKGYTEEQAINTILRGLAYGRTFEDISTNDKVNHMRKDFIVESTVLITFKVFGNALVTSTSNLIQLGRILSVTFEEGALLAGRVVAGGFAAALAAVDIALLVRDWNSDPKFAAELLKLQEDIASEINNLNGMFDLLNSFLQEASQNRWAF